MKRYNFEVVVHLHPDLLDPQGRALKQVLNQLGYEEVEDVRVGKSIVITLSGNSADEIQDRLNEIAKRVLTNPVIENFSIRQLPTDEGSSSNISG